MLQSYHRRNSYIHYTYGEFDVQVTVRGDKFL